MKYFFLLSSFFAFALFNSGCKKKAVAPSSYNFTVIQENFDSTKTAAVANKQNICLMIHADWCNICNTFLAEVLTDEAVINKIKNKIVFGLIDGDKTYGKTYFNLYNIQGFPTFLILDEKGVEITRKSGGLSSAEFITWVTPYLK
jgi:thioredoxin-related protein